MNKQTDDYRFLCIASGVFMVAVLGCLALGVVWVRQSASSTAKQVQKCEAQLQQKRRILAHVNEQFAKAHMPSNLTQDTSSELITPVAGQVRWITVTDRMPAVERPVIREPALVSFELALMEGSRKR